MNATVYSVRYEMQSHANSPHNTYAENFLSMIVLPSYDLNETCFSNQPYETLCAREVYPIGKPFHPFQ